MVGVGTVGVGVNVRVGVGVGVGISVGVDVGGGVGTKRISPTRTIVSKMQLTWAKRCVVVLLRLAMFKRVSPARTR